MDNKTKREIAAVLKTQGRPDLIPHLIKGQPRWTHLFTAPNRGHKYFKSSEDDFIHVADWSGTTPDKTEDGDMWLKPGALVRLSSEDGRPWLAFTVEMPDGDTAGISEDFIAGVEVIKRLGLKVKAADRRLGEAIRDLAPLIST